MVISQEFNYINAIQVVEHMHVPMHLQASPGQSIP